MKILEQKKNQKTLRKCITYMKAKVIKAMQKIYNINDYISKVKEVILYKYYNVL